MKGCESEPDKEEAHERIVASSKFGGKAVPDMAPNNPPPKFIANIKAKKQVNDRLRELIDDAFPPKEEMSKETLKEKDKILERAQKKAGEDFDSLTGNGIDPALAAQQALWSQRKWLHENGIMGPGICNYRDEPQPLPPSIIPIIAPKNPRLIINAR